MKRFSSVFTMVMLASMLLAACGGGTVAQPTAVPGVEPTAAATTAAPDMATVSASEAAGLEGGEMSGVEMLAAMAAGLPADVKSKLDGIKIATQSPLSGPQASLGGGMRNGAELALQQISAMLGIKFALAPFDDQAQPEVGSASAKNAVSDPDILCVVGHLNSGVTLAALPDYQNAKMPLISPSNTTPKLTESGYANAFRVVGRDDLQGPVGARFAQETLKAKTVYVLHDKTEYGQGIADFFKKEAEKLGMTVQAFEGTEEQAVFDSILTPIQAQNPDVIYFSGLYSQIGPFIKQARERGITAPVLGADGLDSPELAALAGSGLEPTYYTSVAAPVGLFPSAAQFAQDYKAKYSADAPPFSPQAYDAMSLCLAGVIKAAADAQARPTREQVLAGVKTLEPFQGIIANYQFNAKGDPSKAIYYILQASTDPAKWNDNKLTTKIEIAPPQ